MSGHHLAHTPKETLKKNVQCKEVSLSASVGRVERSDTRRLSVPHAPYWRVSPGSGSGSTPPHGPARSSDASPKTHHPRLPGLGSGVQLGCVQLAGRPCDPRQGSDGRFAQPWITRMKRVMTPPALVPAESPRRVRLRPPPFNVERETPASAWAGTRPRPVSHPTMF